MTRPLPLRIDPQPGESWLGYLRRNARVYRLDTVTRVLDPLLRTTNGRPRTRTRRGYGIAALPSTYQRLGDYFNLTASEVRAMFVESYTTVTSHWTQANRQRLDLFADGGDGRLWAPAVRPVRQLVRCSECQNEDPDRWALSWWLTAQQVCERHALTLTPPGEKGVKVNRSIAALQQAILKIAGGDGSRIPWTDPETFMSDLTIMSSGWGHHPTTLGTLVPAARHLHSRPGLSQAPAGPVEPSRHRLYGSRATYEVGYPWGDPMRSRLIRDLLALPHPPAHAAMVRYRTPPVGVLRNVPSEPRFYPTLLPTDLYLEHFGSICSHLPTTHGRRVTAAAVWLVAIGPLWGHGPTRTTPFRPLAELQARLDRRGDLARFWATTTNVATTMASDPVDYDRRRSQVTAGALSAIAAAAPQHTVKDLKLWLDLHWACHRLSDNGDHLDFHHQHGTELNRVVTQVLAIHDGTRTTAERGAP